MNLRKTWAAWIGGIAVCTGLGCATTQVSTAHDPTANFARYRTFAVSQGKVIDEGRLDTSDTLVRDRIDTALQHELAAKGLEATRVNPDLIVTYTARAGTFEKLTPNAAAYSMAEVPAPWLAPYDAGTLAIDVIDPITNQVVWRSVAQSDDQSFRKPENIQKAVDKALRKFPATRAG